MSLEALGDQRPIWHPTLRDGTLPALQPGLVIARRAAIDLHVSVGDRVSVVHPVPTGPTTFRLATTTLDRDRHPHEPAALPGIRQCPAAARLHATELVNRISVVPAAGRTADDVKAELLRRPDVAAVQGAAATTEAVDQRIEQFNEILLIAAAMALLIAYNATAINAEERVREHATQFAHGVTVARVIRGGVVEALIIGALGTAVGIAAGRALLSWLINTNMPETMPEIGTLTSVAPFTYVLALVTGTLMVAVAPLLTLRRLRRTDLSGALRVVECYPRNARSALRMTAKSTTSWKSAPATGGR